MERHVNEARLSRESESHRLSAMAVSNMSIHREARYARLKIRQFLLQRVPVLPVNLAELTETVLTVLVLVVVHVI